MYRILLVDDEILVRDAIRENIDWEAMDCTLVADCENGRQALEVIRTQEVDIVLTDILMPYMDGMELSGYLHEHYPEIVVVIFSGFGEFEYAKKAIEYNVSEYLLKPVTSLELREVIGRMKERVDQIRQEKEHMAALTQNASDYHRNLLMIRSKAFEDLVYHTRGARESLQELEGLGIHLEAECYRPVLFDIDVYADISAQTPQKQQESALMAFILYNISDEVMQREKAGYGWMEGNSRVNLLFAGSREALTDQRVTEVLKEIKRQQNEVMGLGVSVALGPWVRRPQELYQAQALAKEALERRYLLGDRLYLDMEKEVLNQPLSLEEELPGLALCLKTGSQQEVQDLLSLLETRIRASLSDRSRVCVYLEQIIRCIREVDLGLPEGELQSQSALREITEQKSFLRAMEELRDYALKVNRRLREAGSSAGQKQALMAMDYLQSHYMDESLNLNMVCSYLNISTSYFSTIFKDLTGETFIEALTRIRMERAKELLRTTTYRNYEIAERVGFSDPHYFGIAFKKLVGMTPTEYARENRR